MENEKPNLIATSGEDGVDSKMMKDFLREVLELKSKNKGDVIVFSADSVIRENIETEETKELYSNIEAFIEESQKNKAEFLKTSGLSPLTSSSEILKEINKIREDAKIDNKLNNQKKLK